MVVAAAQGGRLVNQICLEVYLENTRLFSTHNRDNMVCTTCFHAEKWGMD